MNEYYDQLTLREKVHAAGVVAKLFLSFYGPIVVSVLLGLGDIWTWFHEQAWPFRRSFTHRFGRCLMSASPGFFAV